jgi:hypothetical protein
MKELHDGRRVLDAECKRRQAEDEHHRRLAVISWLSAADSASDHEEALEVQEEEPESGQWIFQEVIVKEWIGSYSPSETILWVNGRPGAGRGFQPIFLSLLTT